MTPELSSQTGPETTPIRRVMVIGTRAPDYFADNILTGLEDAGHDTCSVAPFSGALGRKGTLVARARAEAHQLPALARRIHRHVIDAAEEFRPDIIVNVDHALSYRVIPELRRRTGVPVVFWFPDPPGNLRQESWVLAGYDALFFKDSVLVERYRRTLRLNAFFLPQACNPRWHRPHGDLAGARERPTVLVAGNMYATRFALLRELARRDIDISIHGSPWPRWLPPAPTLRRGYSGHPVFRDEKARAFRSASVVLNNMVSHEGDGLNTRLFEAAGCGAIVLTEHRGILPSLFEVGEEVHAYRGLDDLVEEIFRLAALSHPEREAIGAAASARAHRDHTFALRFDSIVRCVGGSELVPGDFTTPSAREWRAHG